MKCPNNKCASCILAVSLLVTCKFIFARPFKLFFPRNAILYFEFFTSFKTSKIFFEFPDVVRTIKQSPFCPKAFKTFEKLL